MSSRQVKILLLFFLISWRFLYSADAFIKPFAACPDQVLVLYNEEWDRDVDGSLPGNDSREVAEYYVRMHSDPVTGKRPYLLGLKCVHGKKHLNDWVIREKSQDNKDGMVFKGEGRGPKAGECVRNSRRVEIDIKPKGESIDWDSVEIWCHSISTREKKRGVSMVSGIPDRRKANYKYPKIQEGKGRCYRFNANALFPGTVRVTLTAKNKSGKRVRNLDIKYYDKDDFAFSMFGADGVSDELHFQEDVAIPVKEFLESRKNILPDGTSLKDHILYIVICHGLPFSCEGVFGIERGPQAKFSGQGDLGSLEQRLQTLYYGWGQAIVPPVISQYMSGGPMSKKGVQNHRITSAMRHSLLGRHWNPYMHPDTYSFRGKNKKREFIELPPFPEVRHNLPPYYFAYGVSRIDGPGPLEAERQIDYALYGTKYLRPEIDLKVREEIQKKSRKPIKNMPERLKKAEVKGAWGKSELTVLGFRTQRRSIPFLVRPGEDNMKMSETLTGKTGKVSQGYYPGGFDRTVVSSNGWNMGRGASIWRQVDQGVTVSACGGPAYGGGPHITNVSFWDNAVLSKYLFRGRDLGECFLLSTCYVNWSTSLLGDPLFHPDLSSTLVDTSNPEVRSQEDIKINLIPAMGKYTGTITVQVLSTKNEPEVAMLRVYYQQENNSREHVSYWPIYSTRPHVILRDLEPDSTYFYRPVLVDPYGNTLELVKNFGRLSFRTGAVKTGVRNKRSARQGKKSWAINLLKAPSYSESGTIEVDFTAMEDGIMAGISSKEINVTGLRSLAKNPFKIGGPSWGTVEKSPLIKGERATMVLRWRRFPMTRELLLRAKNGREFTLVADVRTPWEKMRMRSTISINDMWKRVVIHSARAFDDAYPASQDACGVVVPPINLKEWKQANL